MAQMSQLSFEIVWMLMIMPTDGATASIDSASSYSNVNNRNYGQGAGHHTQLAIMTAKIIPFKFLTFKMK